MSRARDFADVISGGFDLPAGALDNSIDGFTFVTPVATNGTTAATFTGIPSGVDIIKYTIYRAIPSGVAGLLIRIGDSGGLEDSNYSRGESYSGGSSGTVTSQEDTSASSWALAAFNSDTNIITHHGEILRTHGNKFVLTAHAHYHNAPKYTLYYTGFKELSAELTQISFFWGGSITFNDANGYARIAYQ